MRIVPAPFPAPKHKKIRSKGASGTTFEYEFGDDVRQEVELMAAAGFSVERIAKCLHIDPDTLQKHFEEEITSGPVRVNYALARTIYFRAIRGDSVAAIWWSKNRMGWREPKDEQTDIKLEVKDRFALAVKGAPETIAAVIQRLPQVKRALFGKAVGKVVLGESKEPIDGSAAKVTE